jgi:hypothetical protein
MALSQLLRKPRVILPDGIHMPTNVGLEVPDVVPCLLVFSGLFVLERGFDLFRPTVPVVLRLGTKDIIESLGVGTIESAEQSYAAMKADEDASVFVDPPAHRVCAVRHVLHYEQGVGVVGVFPLEKVQELGSRFEDDVLVSVDVLRNKHGNLSQGYREPKPTAALPWG